MSSVTELSKAHLQRDSGGNNTASLITSGSELCAVSEDVSRQLFEQLFETGDD